MERCRNQPFEFSGSTERTESRINENQRVERKLCRGHPPSAGHGLGRLASMLPYPCGKDRKRACKIHGIADQKTQQGE